MGFSRQEYWNGSPFFSPGDLPNPGIEPRSPALQADSLPLSCQGSPLKKKLGYSKFAPKKLPQENNSMELLYTHTHKKKQTLIAVFDMIANSAILKYTNCLIVGK